MTSGSHFAPLDHCIPFSVLCTINLHFYRISQICEN
uniref:Uncharacterized protein n=1 Tax=Arundo donax TaxID=35708 RepID=A0A0A9BTL4_ARUDO